MYLFPDTNILLHYGPLAHLDWQATTGSKRVELVLCLEVIRELDRKKGEPSLGERARRAIAEIREFDAYKRELRPGVRLSVFDCQVRIEDVPPTLSIDAGDDRILHLVQQFQHRHPGEDVRIVTEDYGMEIRCKATGVQVVRLDPGLRYPDPSDEAGKKVRQLQAELAELKNRLPRMSLLGTTPGIESTEARETVVVALSQGDLQLRDVEREVAAEAAKHPRHGPTHAQINPRLREVAGNDYIPAFESARYNSDVERYLDEYRKYLLELNANAERRARSIGLVVWADNSGGAPAEDVQGELIVPSGLAAFDANDIGLQRRGDPKPPRVPHPPRTLKDSYHKLGGGVDAQLMIERAHSLEVPNVTSRCIRNPDGTHQVRFWIRSLRHLKRIRACALVLGFRCWEDVRPYEFRWSCTAANHPKPFEGRIILKAARIEQP